MIYHGGVSVLAEDDNTMDAADKALINDFILDEAYRIMIPELRILSKDIPILMWHATVPVNLSGYICTC